ncbi:hypothetical protein I5E65_19210 [Pseudomonas aeruginosa]|nr:hypothetical protein [Pseudomonas aeruginosa]HBN8232208.1 hypothetical protein [Pseudomonas aeruginosa]
MEKLFALATEKVASLAGGKASGGAAGFLLAGEKPRERVVWEAPQWCVARLWTAQPCMAAPSIPPSITADFAEKPGNPVFTGQRTLKGNILEAFSRTLSIGAIPVEKLLANCAVCMPPGPLRGFSRALVSSAGGIPPYSPERLLKAC